MGVRSNGRGTIFQALRWGALSALIMGSAAHAETECAVPSEDVVTAVMLRAGPGTDTEILGRLGPGELVTVLDGVPNWHRVQLPAGGEAFASKRWTDLIQCPVALGAAAPEDSSSGTFSMHIIDVGTGLAVLALGEDFALLYDAGSNDDSSIGDRNRVLAYLRQVAPDLTRIDHLVLSHPHQDHVALMPDVFNAYDVGHVWNSGAFNNICSYRSLLKAIAAEPGVRYHTALQGPGVEAVELNAKCNQPSQTVLLKHHTRIGQEKVQLGRNASIQFLYADGSLKTDLNDNSLVARLRLGSHTVLLMGDSGGGGRQAPSVLPKSTSVEGQLLTCCLSDLEVDVVVVGHHGSMTSSREAFLDATLAKNFIMSSGPKAYSGTTLPDSVVIDALAARGEVWRTDVDDEDCAVAAQKTGEDNDGRPGGCSNVVVNFSPQSVSVQYANAP